MKECIKFHTLGTSNIKPDCHDGYIYNNNHLCRIINYSAMYRTQHNNGTERDREVGSKIGLEDLSKSCTQVYLQIFANCINLQRAIRISNNHAFRTCTTPSRTFSPILSSIGLLDNELPRKEIISTDGRTDRQMDRRTNRQKDKIVHTSLFADICKLHKFATCN